MTDVSMDQSPASDQTNTPSQIHDGPHAAGPLAAQSFGRLKAIFIGSAGNLVEWYDFYCYSAFALYFAQSFFPTQDTTAQMLSTAGIFALGFFIRPVGGWLFGHIGDVAGRRRALMLSVLLMCFGSLMIAVTPTYERIGSAAPTLLMVARLLQGLSLGGEYGASATYLSEMATGARRGFYASFQYVTLIGGQLTALLVLLVLQNFLLSGQQLRAWGWRVAFFVGAMLALIALIMRRGLFETEIFRQQARFDSRRQRGRLRELLAHPKEALIVVGLTMGGTLAFYVYTTYMQKFLRLSVGLTDGQSTAVSAASLIFAMLLQPIYGALSDRIGRRPLLIGFGILGTMFTVPLLTAISRARGPWEALALIAVAWLIVSGYTSINAVVKAELFPAKIRATGVGLPYAIAVSLFGGSAEYVAFWFKSIGRESGFYWYATGVIACTLLVAVFMRDTKRVSAIDKELLPAARA
ncbi:MAG TPA: MFS transporter [Burkholderiaceae bacterium]|nr:MFS transporter [Burkholderiaceae bacterium]